MNWLRRLLFYWALIHKLFLLSPELIYFITIYQFLTYQMDNRLSCSIGIPELFVLPNLHRIYCLYVWLLKLFSSFFVNSIWPEFWSRLIFENLMYSIREKIALDFIFFLILLQCFTNQIWCTWPWKYSSCLLGEAIQN